MHEYVNGEQINNKLDFDSNFPISVLNFDYKEIRKEETGANNLAMEKYWNNSDMPIFRMNETIWIRTRYFTGTPRNTKCNTHVIIQLKMICIIYFTNYVVSAFRLC